MSNGLAAPRILLIGVAGQIGWELRRSLRPLGELVIAARQTAAGVVPLDLTKVDRLRAVIREVRPTLIVNAAAYALVDQAENEPDVAMAVNATAPAVMQEEANRLGAAVVHYSTDYVFDGGGTKPWVETDSTGPLGAYGRSKLAGEQAVAAAGGAHIILRTSWIYGVHGVNFVKKILKLAQDRETLRIVADQVGAPTSARYVAEATTALLAQARGDFTRLLAERGGLFHCCCDGEVSWHGFTEAIVEGARACGMLLKVAAVLPIPSSEFPTPARRPLNSRLNCDRLRQEYRIAAPSWRDALADTLPVLLRYEFGVGR